MVMLFAWEFDVSVHRSAWINRGHQVDARNVGSTTVSTTEYCLVTGLSLPAADRIANDRKTDGEYL